MNNEEFKKTVLKQYPNAILHTDEQNNIMAAVKNDNTIRIIGCQVCFGDTNIKIKNKKLFLGNIEAVSVSSIIEDDSQNPAMKVLFFCPICSRIIVHPSISMQQVVGKGFDTE